MGTSTAPSGLAVTTRLRDSREPSLFAAGQLIAGRYRLLRYIARGGMAEVWLATHESLKSEVAIKFIDYLLAQDQDGAVERFRLEAQLSARLGARTKHIVAVHDAGEHEGVPFLVMEFVEGHTLEHTIEQKGQLSLSLCADLLDQVADALSVAHELGVIHRDLKPSNLMLIDEPDGSITIKITDFGIAKALRKDLALDRPKDTRMGEMIGSPAYMSPEQIDGAGELDARSDIWSLGVLVYEALTGQTCFKQRALTELVIAIATASYKPASHVRADLPKGIDAWFDRAIAVNPEDRWSSTTDMAASFRTLVAPARNRRRAALGFAAGALAIIVGGSMALLASRSPTSEPAKPVTTATSEVTVRAVAPAPSPAVAPSIDLPAPSATASSAAAPLSALPHKAPPSASASTKPTAAPEISATPTATATPAAPPSPPRPKKEYDRSEIQ